MTLDSLYTGLLCIQEIIFSVDDLKNQKNQTNVRVDNLMREIAHAQKRNPLSDLDEILQYGRYPRRNHVGKFL